MNFEVLKDKSNAEAWRVEAINYAGDGEVYVTIFAGPEAEERAHAYAEWINSSSLAKAS